MCRGVFAAFFLFDVYCVVNRCLCCLVCVLFVCCCVMRFVVYCLWFVGSCFWIVDCRSSFVVRCLLLFVRRLLAFDV